MNAEQCTDAGEFFSEDLESAEQFLTWKDIPRGYRFPMHRVHFAAVLRHIAAAFPGAEIVHDCDGPNEHGTVGPQVVVEYKGRFVSYGFGHIMDFCRVKDEDGEHRPMGGICELVMWFRTSDRISQQKNRSES